MAKTTAPLLSLGATGQFGKTMVASTWKGLKTMRSYVVPANPNTTLQQGVRVAFAACVAAWRNYVTAATARTAWSVTASASATPMAGFNAFVGAMSVPVKTDADCSTATTITAIAAMKTNLVAVNMDDGAQGDEAGDFYFWYGPTPTSLMKQAMGKALVGGTVDSEPLEVAGAVIYVKVQKSSRDRSGLYKVTLTA